jgi:glycosyltransferase involved in cell wall biosynthesis
MAGDRFLIGEDVRVAVLTLTRDRLPYTQHCFDTLRENAGCDYHHVVLDQGSTDGTQDFLNSDLSTDSYVLLPENIGINRGLNLLLDTIAIDDYDVIVKFDNDCELLTPNTLATVCGMAIEHDIILSPRIHGLRNPVWSFGEWHGIDLTPIVGGIFMATPADVYQEGFRYREDVGLWGTDDSDLCQHVGRCGYVRGYDANHYLTTDGQHADIPHYFARTLAEGKPSIL